MHKRMFPATSIVMGAVFLLIACGNPASTEAQTAARIDSITNDPADPSNGGVITFTILYSNPSADEPLNSPILDVIYSENMEYCPSGDSCNSEPPPDAGEPDSRSLQYSLEDPLNPGAQNAVTVSFTTGDIPPDISLTAKISGTTSQGSSEDSLTFVIRSDGVTETQYPEGAVIELPRQDSEAILHSERGEFESDPTKVEVKGGEYALDRTIIYLDVYEGENLVNSFSPLIGLYIDIPEDLKELAASQDLVILLYDKEVKQWIPCNGNPENMTATTQCSATTISENLERAWVTVSSWTSGTGWGKR